MLSRRGILGALLRSRCDYGAKPAPTAPRSRKCTEKGKVTGRPTATATAAAAAAMGTIATTSALAALGTVSCTYSGNWTPDPLMALGPEQASCLEQMVVKETNEANETNEAKEARERPGWSGPPRKSRKHSLWQLAGVEVRAFRGRDAGSVPGRVVFRAAILLSLVAYARRVHPSGRALCLLWLRPLRVVVAMMALISLVCAAGALYSVLGVAIAAVMAAALLPFTVGAVKARPGRKELAKLTPPGRHVYVHSVASQLPGAGAQLLRGLTQEADDKGWSLVLDASNEKLVRYYQQFGFVVRGAGVRMPDGARYVRMWRPPVTPERGPLWGRTGYEATSTP